MSTTRSILKAFVPRRIRDWLRDLRQRRAVRRMLASFSPRVVEHTYAGERLRVTLSDPESAAWYDRDWSAVPEIEFLLQHRLRRGARVFDVGAHQGVVALLLARTVGVDGEVVAVEPNPFNIAVLRQNLAANGAMNVIARQAAAGATPGRARMAHELNARLRLPDEPGGYDVDCVTIDQLAATHGHPDVVYVDVEGFEDQVLRGATRLREAGRSDWFVEVHVGVGLESTGATVDSVLAHFPLDRYALFTAEPDGGDFQSLAARPGLMASRFFLIAVSLAPAGSR